VSAPGFTTPVPVRWSDIDMYQHVNHATMVTILEEARVPFLKEPFGVEITTVGLLIHEVRPVTADLSTKPSVIAETQLAAVHIKEQRLQRLSPTQREYLQRWMR
jgi:acyl-CoA thioester hydrolase